MICDDIEGVKCNQNDLFVALILWELHPVMFNVGHEEYNVPYMAIVYFWL